MHPDFARPAPAESARNLSHAHPDKSQDMLTVTVRPTGFTLGKDGESVECQSIAELTAAIAAAALGTPLSRPEPALLELTLSAASGPDLLDALYYAVGQIEHAIEAEQSLSLTDGRFPGKPGAPALEMRLRLPQRPVFFGLDMAAEERP
jgi:hypothetical protein